MPGSATLIVLHTLLGTWDRYPSGVHYCSGCDALYDWWLGCEGVAAVHLQPAPSWTTTRRCSHDRRAHWRPVHHHVEWKRATLCDAGRLFGVEVRFHGRVLRRDVIRHVKDLVDTRMTQGMSAV